MLTVNFFFYWFNINFCKQERDQKEEEEKKKERVNQMQNSISWWEETIAAERQSAMHQRDLQFSGQPQMYKQSILHP